MNTVKTVQVGAAVVAMLCFAFGYGTAWFAVGMFLACISLILEGLVHYVRKAELSALSCVVCDHPFGQVRHLCTDGPVDGRTPVVVFRGDDVELPYRPVDRRPHWDTDVMGAPE